MMSNTREYVSQKNIIRASVCDGEGMKQCVRPIAWIFQLWSGEFNPKTK